MLAVEYRVGGEGLGVAPWRRFMGLAMKKDLMRNQ